MSLNLKILMCSSLDHHKRNLRNNLERLNNNLNNIFVEMDEVDEVDQVNWKFYQLAFVELGALTQSEISDLTVKPLMGIDKLVVLIGNEDHKSLKKLIETVGKTVISIDIDYIPVENYGANLVAVACMGYVNEMVKKYNL